MSWRTRGQKRELVKSRAGVRRHLWVGWRPNGVGEQKPRHYHAIGKTVWDNIVASCYACNSTKRGRTPEQAGMKLLRAPVKPKALPMTTIIPREGKHPPVWSDYCAVFA